MMVTIVDTRTRIRDAVVSQLPERVDHQSKYLLFTEVRNTKNIGPLEVLLWNFKNPNEGKVILRDHPTGLSYRVAMGDRIYTDENGELAALEGNISIVDITPFAVYSRFMPIKNKKGETDATEDSDRPLPYFGTSRYNFNFVEGLAKYPQIGDEFVKSIHLQRDFVGISNYEGHRIALKPNVSFDWGGAPLEIQELYKSLIYLMSVMKDPTFTGEGYIIPTLNTTPMIHAMLDHERGIKFSEHFAKISQAKSQDERKVPLQNLASVVHELFESAQGNMGQFVPLNLELVAPQYRNYNILKIHLLGIH